MHFKQVSNFPIFPTKRDFREKFIRTQSALVIHHFKGLCKPNTVTEMVFWKIYSQSNGGAKCDKNMIYENAATWARGAQNFFWKYHWLYVFMLVKMRGHSMGLYIWNFWAAPKIPHFGVTGKIVILTKKCIFMPYEDVLSLVFLV